jgi:hypothetical protein
VLFEGRSRVFPCGEGRCDGAERRRSGVFLRWVFEQGPDATGGFGQPVWLWQETRPNLAGSAGMADRGGENYVNTGMMVNDPARKTDPINGARHIDVAEDEIDLCPAREDGNGLSRAGASITYIPGASQKLGHGTADQDLVFHDQDRRLPRCCLV